MTTADKLSYLIGTKTAIKDAIIAKGVEVADTDTFRDYADKVGEISGGGEPTDGDYLVQFIGYRGEVLQSGKYFAGDVVNVPDDPSYDGLVFDGWSSPVTITDGTVTVTNQDLTIGAMFDTVSGATEIDIVLTNVTGTTVALTGITGFTLIEWGDGSTSTELGSHTYSSIGEYTILISGSDMVFSGASEVDYALGTYVTVSIFGAASNHYATGIRFSNMIIINGYAFNYCYNLNSVTIPSSINIINSYAFNYCYNLNSVTIPSSINTINIYAFNYCYNLNSVTIPSSINTINGYAFNYCHNLNSVTIPSSVTIIDGRAFNYCYNLNSVTIPSSVTSIGAYAFNYCYNLTEYDLTDYTSTDPVPTLSSTNVFTGINGFCKMYFRDQAILDNFASATNWSTYANYMYVKE